jgi:hypothetical protein
MSRQYFQRHTRVPKLTARQSIMHTRLIRRAKRRGDFVTETILQPLLIDRIPWSSRKDLL